MFDFDGANIGLVLIVFLLSLAALRLGVGNPHYRTGHAKARPYNADAI